MTGTGARVNYFQLIRCQGGVFLTNLGKLCLHFRLLLGFFQIVMPFGIFRVTVSGSIGRLFFLGRKKLFFHIRMSLQPQTTKRVLDHVTNDPVRREKLGCCRDVFFCDFHILFQSGENIIFFLAVIILIQPADNLDSILPVILRYQLNHLLNYTTFTKEVVREQKLGIVSNFLKHTRKHTIESIALRDQKILIQFIIVIGFLIGVDFLHIKSVQLQMNGFGDNLRLEVVFLVREHTHMGWEVAVDLHKTQGREAVEPCVGNLLHNLLISFFFNLRNQGSSLLLLGRRKQMPTHTIVIWISDLFIGNTVFQRPLAHTGD